MSLVKRRQPSLDSMTGSLEISSDVVMAVNGGLDDNGTSQQYVFIQNTNHFQNPIFGVDDDQRFIFPESPPLYHLRRGYLLNAEAMPDAELTTTPCLSAQNISSDYILVLRQPL